MAARQNIARQPSNDATAGRLVPGKFDSVNLQPMKTIAKIMIAGIAGTTTMTLYSYWKSKREREEYVEPVMLNKLIDNAGDTPEIRDQDTHPAGWGLHYLTGIAFVAAYCFGAGR